MCWKFKHSHKILPCWQQRLCPGKSWHTNRCIHIYTAAFQQKDCSPKSPQSEKRKEEGCTALSQAMLFCSSLRDNQHWYQSLFSCRSSLPSPVGASPQQLHCILGCSHLWGVSLGHPYPCTAPVTVPSATDKGQYLQSPGCNEGIWKGHSSWHQNLLELFCWVINVTALLQTRVCFVILPPHSKWICWVILRKRKKGWPILMPSDWDTKREKAFLHCFPLVFINKNNV